MYTTCIRCRRALGRNAVLSALPIGRRVAFELSHGWLWVVCRRCGEWNLVPLEDRWEALEECERAFASAESRASDHAVSLARTSDGTELLRIGPDARRSDIANWRYGRRLHRRRGFRLLFMAGIGGLALAALTTVGLETGSLLAAVWTGLMLATWLNSLKGSRPGRVLARMPDGAGGTVTVRTGDLHHLRLVARRHDAHFRLKVHTLLRDVTLDGPAVVEALAALLPVINWRGGSPAEVAEAVGLVDAAELRGSTRGQDVNRAPWERVLERRKAATLVVLPPVERLALEMAVAEAVELKSLHGTAIRYIPAVAEATGIATISDSLLLPPGLADWLERHRAPASSPAPGGVARQSSGR